MADHIPSDSVVVKNARFAVKAELNKKATLNQPVSHFNAKTGEIYRRNEDGSIVVVRKVMKRGRYSEQRR